MPRCTRAVTVAVAAFLSQPVVADAQTATPLAPPQTAPDATPAAPKTAPSAEHVTGAAAWERLKGNTITGKVSGQPFSEFFDTGGGVKYVDQDGLSTGTWTLQSAKVCFDFPDDDDRSCSIFTITGATSGSATDDDGVTTRFEIEPGNAKGM